MASALPPALPQRPLAAAFGRPFHHFDFLFFSYRQLSFLIILDRSARSIKIAIIQTCSALAFIFKLSAMISLYFDIDTLGNWLFFSSIVLMLAAMIQFTIEIQIANSALDVHLSDLEKHQKWQD